MEMHNIKEERFPDMCQGPSKKFDRTGILPSGVCGPEGLTLSQILASGIIKN